MWPAAVLGDFTVKTKFVCAISLRCVQVLCTDVCLNSSDFHMTQCASDGAARSVIGYQRDGGPWGQERDRLVLKQIWTSAMNRLEYSPAALHFVLYQVIHFPGAEHHRPVISWRHLGARAKWKILDGSANAFTLKYKFWQGNHSKGLGSARQHLSKQCLLKCVWSLKYHSGVEFVVCFPKIWTAFRFL